MMDWEISPNTLTDAEIAALFAAGIVSPPELAPKTMPKPDVVHVWTVSANLS